MIKRSIALVCAVCLAPFASSLAEERSDAEDQQRMNVLVNNLITPNQSRGEFVRRLDQFYFALTRNGSAITPDTRNFEDLRERAIQRSQYIAQWLQRDFDNDGTVTRAELQSFFERQAKRPLQSEGNVVVEPTKEQIATILETFVTEGLAEDRDENGIITFDEMRSAAEANAPSQNRHQPMPVLSAYMDTDGDGRVSQKEFRAVVMTTWKKRDANSDGVISDDEYRRAL